MLERMEALIREWNMLPQGCTVLCALSGGADSVCLLHALYHLRPRLGFSLAAAHYNHNLRGEESDQDAAFAEQFVRLCCGEQRLPDGTVLPPVRLFTGSGDVAGEARLRGVGVEEAARDMRYAFLRQAAAKAGAGRIATAHNADDNGETILFHLARGSGLRGLTGIPPVRDGLIRPLLTTPRKEIEAYLLRYSLPWREDHTNRSDAYSRNRIRHQVTPVLEDLFPGFSVRTAETAARLRADEDYLNQQAAQISGQASAREDGLSLPASLIAQAPQPLAVRAVRQLIGRLNGGDQDCSAAHLDAVIRLCRSPDPSARLNLPYGLTARREYGLICLTRAPEAPALDSAELSLPGVCVTGPWHILCEEAVYAGQPQTPFEFWLKAEGLTSLSLRSRAVGDSLKLPGRPHKTVKKWCIDLKIPAVLRAQLPVLFQGEALLAVGGLGPAEEAVPSPGQPAWHIVIQSN